MTNTSDDHADNVADMLEDYLNGHLSDEQRLVVEQRLTVDAELAAQLKFQQRLQGALRSEAAAAEQSIAEMAEGQFSFDTVAAKIQPKREKRGVRFFWPVLAACALAVAIALPSLQQSGSAVNEFETAFDSATERTELHVLLRAPLSERDQREMVEGMGLRLLSSNQGGTLLILSPGSAQDSIEVAAQTLDDDPRVIATKVVGKESQ